MEEISSNGATNTDNDVKYSIRSSDNFGRYLVASEDFPERTQILHELPIVYAPTDDCNRSDEQTPTSSSSIFCLNCCVLLKTDENCDQCGWPLCKVCNKKIGTLHEENECKIFQDNEAKFPPPNGWPVFYKSILILRILLLIKTKDPSIWDTFFSRLEHHNDTRRRKGHCIKGDAMIVRNMKYFLRQNYENLVGDESEELVQILIGVVNVNAFGSTTKGKQDNVRKTKSMFKEASIFAHSCAPNCTWNIKLESNHKPQIEIFTSVPVKKGELLTIPYNTRHLFFGTLKRQILIESIAHFECKCSRCNDPTELGTYMSSLRCFKCDKGFLISKNSCFQESDWACLQCGIGECVAKIVYFITDVEEYFDKIQMACLDWQKEVEMLQKLFVKHCGHLLHENHYTLQEISSRILELMVEALQEANLSQIELFLWHCEYLKGIADVILPGCNGYQDQLTDYRTEGLFHRQRVVKSQDYK